MDTTSLKQRSDRPRPLPLKSAGFLLSKYCLFFLLGMFIYAALVEEFAILALVGTILATAGLTKLWSQISLVGIECSQKISKGRIFPGEYTEIGLQLINRKPLPLPWIQVEKEFPPTLKPDVALLPGGRADYGCLRHITALLWYRSILWRHRIYGTKRGYYLLSPTKITSGDIFGLYSQTITLEMPDALIVYPNIFTIEGLSPPHLMPGGEIRARNQIFYDPTHPAGVREYCSGDSLRHIHWKVSARRQKLQVKVFEPAIASKTALFLAVETFFDEESCQEEKFELGIRAVASIAYHWLEEGNPVGVFINTQLADSGRPASLPPSSHRHQIGAILEILAKTTSSPSGCFEQFIKNEGSRLPYGTTVVVVVDRLSDNLYLLLNNLQGDRRKLLILQTSTPERKAEQTAIPLYGIHYQGLDSKIIFEASR